MSLHSSLETLANYRSTNTRASQEIVEKGVLVLEKSGLSKLGEDAWAFLEQLGVAALDVGRIDVADDCITLLAEKFPGSPRVEILQGIRIEVTESPKKAIDYYNALLEADESNAAAWKRKIAVMHSSPAGSSTSAVVSELSAYLDTFYTDAPAWILLSSIYSSNHQYEFAQQALAHAMVLAPQNPFYVMLSAENAWDSGDAAMCLRFWLRAVELLEEDLDPKDAKEKPSSVATRCWFGVKMCTKVLRNGAHKESLGQKSLQPIWSSDNPRISDAHLDKLDELATECLSAVYVGSKSAGRTEVMSWLSS